jgi:hypothetical protein
MRHVCNEVEATLASGESIDIDFRRARFYASSFEDPENSDAELIHGVLFQCDQIKLRIKILQGFFREK